MKHTGWHLRDGSDSTSISTGGPEDPNNPHVRIRIDTGGYGWAEKDYTPEDARLIWWALGAALDYVEGQEDD